MIPLLLLQLVLLLPVIRERLGWPWSHDSRVDSERQSLLDHQTKKLGVSAIMKRKAVGRGSVVEESTFGSNGSTTSTRPTLSIEGVTGSGTDLDGVDISAEVPQNNGNNAAMGLSSTSAVARAEATAPKPSWRELGYVMVDANFWLLNITFFAGCGGGLVIINNIAQMVQSLMGARWVGVCDAAAGIACAGGVVGHACRVRVPA